MLKLGTGFIYICGVVICLSRGQTQGSGENCSRFQHFSSVCVLFFSLWSPGGAAEGQMLNVSTNVSKTTSLHNIEFPSRGRSGFPCGVGVPEAGGSKCVCVCVLLHDLLQYPAVVCWCLSSRAGQDVGLLHVRASTCPLRGVPLLSSWLQLHCRNVPRIHSGRLFFFPSPSRNQHLSHPSWEIELYLP